MKATKWYYVGGEERIGPLEQPSFDNLVSQGTISPETLVWREGMAEWKPYSETSQAPSAEQMAGDHVACTECGGVFPKEEVIAFRGSYVCAACKPVFIAKITQGVASSAELNYAGFWTRFVAKILDGWIVWIPINILCYSLFEIEVVYAPEMAPAEAFFTLFSFYLVGISYTWLLTWKFGGTPGKLILGLRVVTANGEPIDLWRALGRVFAEYLNFFTLLIGYIIAAFDSEKRALHDHICGTRVIHK